MSKKSCFDDNQIYELIFDGKPIAKARPRFYRRGNYVGTYRPNSEQDIETAYKRVAIMQLREQGLFAPIKRGVPVKLSMSFSFEPPKSYSAKKRAGMNGSPHTSKPDFDNIEKFYKDMLNGILYEDDSQIAFIGESSKLWGERAGVRIRAEIFRRSAE